MIPLGLRLVMNGGREAVTRLVILALAVGLGVGLLLTAVAATNAVNAWNNRHAWFWTGTASCPRARAAGPPRCGGTPAATPSPARRSTASSGRHRLLVPGAAWHPP